MLLTDSIDKLSLPGVLGTFGGAAIARPPYQQWKLNRVAPPRFMVILVGVKTLLRRAKLHK
jgi:hypothetical protein